MEIVVPDDYIGDVIGQVNSKRGEVTRMEGRGNTQFVHADVPLANTFGYAMEISEVFDSGTGTYTMKHLLLWQMRRGVVLLDVKRRF